MQSLRFRLTHLTRFVLVWFVLSIGAAVASPMVNPKAMDLVCSSGGGMKLVVAGDEDASSTGHVLDCPLCASIIAPPPALNTQLGQTPPLAHALHPRRTAHIVAVTAPPLPSRGPPEISC